MGWAISELCGSLFSDLEKYYCAFFVKKNIFAHSLTVNFLFYLFDYFEFLLFCLFFSNLNISHDLTRFFYFFSAAGGELCTGFVDKILAWAEPWVGVSKSQNVCLMRFQAADGQPCWAA